MMSDSLATEYDDQMDGSGQVGYLVWYENFQKSEAKSGFFGGTPGRILDMLVMGTTPGIIDPYAI